jgi:hypothetical protein
MEKVAAMALSWLMELTVQVFPLVLSHPDQPVSAEPLPGVAVRVTFVPLTRTSEQSLPQLIPVPVTVPPPVPDF